ncbi:hypothetical protein LCGC14_2370770 [marine sediment metagenome]|uniref:Uncharacterized protein n=1 Tax=marine sediment metagenome TaxID=412755 RepID=A0A0F9EGC7_9ZZZZ
MVWGKFYSGMLMNKVERKASGYVNAGKVHVTEYTTDQDSGIETASGYVDGTQRWSVTVTPAGSRCDCPFGEAHGITTNTHSHDTALRLAAWQIERINE